LLGTERWTGKTLEPHLSKCDLRVSQNFPMLL
jgi:hypothetical protein